MRLTQMPARASKDDRPRTAVHSSILRGSHHRMTGEQSSGSGGFRLRLSSLHELPDARGGERQLARLNAEIAQSICDGIGHDAARGNDAALAGSPGPEGIYRGRVLLEHDGADIGKITGGGNE